MGVFDDAKDLVENIDFDEPHDIGNGFDPSVCKGCEHHETETRPDTCGKCGCPTSSVSPMALSGSPPTSCPYTDEHADGG